MRKGMIVGVVSLCLLSFLAGGGLAQQAVKEVRIGVAGPMKAGDGSLAGSFHSTGRDQ
jgi:hypothetical protein